MLPYHPVVVDLFAQYIAEAPLAMAGFGCLAAADRVVRLRGEPEGLMIPGGPEVYSVVLP